MTIAAAIKAAAGAAAAVGGVKISIQRGDVRKNNIPVTLGNSNFLTVGAEGNVIRIRSQDYLIEAHRYDFGDGQVEPVRGDKVIRTECDGEHTYELLDLPNENSWRWSDSYRVRFRLHTKEISKPE
jgi:hypothetical protein